MSIEFQHEESERGGRYTARIEGIEEVAEMTYTRRSADRVSLDHTFSPPSMRGKGVALALALHVVEDARARGHKITPVCSYFRAQVERHPDWADVIAE